MAGLREKTKKQDVYKRQDQRFPFFLSAFFMRPEENLFKPFPGRIVLDYIMERIHVERP